MTLTEYNDIEQRSDEWFNQRRGIVTASAVGQLVTPKTLKSAANDHSRALIAALAAERIAGWTDPSYISFDMQRGIDDEPRAVEVYTEHFAPVRTSGFMVRDDWGYSIGYSPDGLVGDDGLIEVKSRRPKEHVRHVVGGEVPVENMAQIQCGLLVSGRAWCDYLSYCGGLQLWVKRVLPDPLWFDAIVTAADEAEKAITQMVDDYRAAVDGLPMTERNIELEMVI